MNIKTSEEALKAFFTKYTPMDYVKNQISHATQLMIKALMNSIHAKEQPSAFP
uniref:Uncharacterized protein n=1 Tax=Rhizophora mucronata TaxID=61149 RepID=A0A2P2Q873_RHIMU